ncbi:MAG: mannose-1-phosphate guanyltransferase [Hormoscilla sp. SP12CHS1]|nr:mannose-1-phosphate guanyltransferase [Hormoscilla sp. SP12CHS1]
MRAVLMAGGSGTRLRPLTCDLPKPMVPILNRPIAEHIVNLLRRHQIREIIATLYYMPDVMRDYFGDGADFGVRISYAVEEDQPLGTAGCVKNIAELLDSTFLVISGDSITDFDLTAAIAFHKQKGSKATIILAQVPNPLEFGVVITDSNQRISRFLEKPSTSEIFSDTVNTGTYILEPEVLDYLSEDQESDFSKDLFPQLLENNEPMYGYVAKEYWCDVGHLDAYREAQYDALSQQVKLEEAYEQKDPGVWVGHNTYIDPSAKIEPPVLIGKNCRIGQRVQLDAGTVIGDNVMIAKDANLKRPIIWNGAIVGEEAQLRGCTIGRGSRVDRRAQILEGAVVGSLSNVGEEAKIAPQVRVWPNKEIEAGAILNINLIWGNIVRRNLFSQRGVQGLANIDITPEFAVKLGVAYGSTLKSCSQVTVSRDQRTISRMVSQSLIAGLMSAGINVQNLEATALPIVRTVIPTLAVAGGIHVRAHPERPDALAIEILDRKGINISKAREKKIEGAYFKEDLRRSPLQEIGNVAYPSDVLSIYMTAFEKHLDVKAIKRVYYVPRVSLGTRVVIDYAYAVNGAVLPQLLAKFGCDALVLNASLNQTPLSVGSREGLLDQLARVVEALKATMGVQVSANGEQLILVDETGSPIRGESLTALMVQMMLTAHGSGGTIVVPVHASSAVEQIALRHDGRVIRTKANPRAVMEASHANPHVILGGSGDMGFIFPQLHPGFDAMFCTAKLIEMLKLQDLSLGKIRSELPRVYHKQYTIRCPWNIKGALMRYLVGKYPATQLELVDGVKIFNQQSKSRGGGTVVTPTRTTQGISTDSWVLILPDAGEPLVHIFANSNDRRVVEATLWESRNLVKDFVESDVPRQSRGNEGGRCK